MINLAVTKLVSDYHCFDKSFWLGYKVLEKLYPNFETIKMKLLASKRIDKSYIEVVGSEQYNLECDMLNAEWTAENEEAKRVGTETHLYILNLFSTDLKTIKSELQIDTDLYQVLQLEAFLNCSDGIFVEHKLEWELDPEYHLIGIPDCFIIHDGIVDIVDYKTSDKISFKSMFEVGKKRTKKLKYPLNSLDDCNGVHYNLLLSIYMWMIIKLRPDLKPGKLRIIWIKDLKVKKSFDVEYLSDLIDKLMIWHLKHVKIKKEMENCKEIIY